MQLDYIFKRKFAEIAQSPEKTPYFTLGYNKTITNMGFYMRLHSLNLD